MPVLSKITVSILAILSIACNRLIKIPRLTNALALANIAAGVAKDNAQGHVTISTAAAVINARPWSTFHNKAAAVMALKIMKNRKGLATRSANCDNLGFSMAAWLIKLTI